MLPIFFATFVAAVSAGVISNGACPDVKPIENYNLTAYQGVWYEISKYPTPAQNANGKCPSAEYKVEGDIIKVKNAYVLNGAQNYIEGTARLAPDAKGAAKLLVSFTFGGKSRDSPLSVVLTDYQNYAIAYNCKYDEKTKSHETTAWILSRTKKLEGDYKKAVDNFIAAHPNALDATKLVGNDFSDEACKFSGTSAITDDPYAKH